MPEQDCKLEAELDAADPHGPLERAMAETIATIRADGFGTGIV